MIPVAVPYIAKNSTKYVDQAIASGAVSGLFGDYIPAFEKRFAEFVGVQDAVSCCNGTVAIHLALAAHGIGPGDEVLVSALTNMATFFAVLYCGATPIPVDVERDTLCMSITDCAQKISPRTKAICVVHLFGQPAEMAQLSELCASRGLPLFEDCAESHGSTYAGRQTGSWGRAGCFSFFANKNINTGEGGMVTTNDAQLADRMRSMRSLSFGKKEKFLHEGIGFNYRMDNLNAALGCAQMDEVESIIDAKIVMGKRYDELLASESRLALPVSRRNVKNTYWMYHVRLQGDLAARRAEILDRLREAGVETRPGFVSFTLQTFADKDVVRKHRCPVAEEVSFSTFYLPSSHGIPEQTQTRIVDALLATLEHFS